MRSLEEARASARAGIDLAAEATEAKHPGWVSLAVQRLREFARSQAKRAFTIEQAREKIAPKLPKPNDERTWGAVTRAALMQGVIERTGTYAPTASSHGSPKREYVCGARA